VALPPPNVLGILNKLFIIFSMFSTTYTKVNPFGNLNENIQIVSLETVGQLFVLAWPQISEK
jgi:hypothetical protein